LHKDLLPPIQMVSPIRQGSLKTAAQQCRKPNSFHRLHPFYALRQPENRLGNVAFASQKPALLVFRLPCC